VLCLSFGVSFLQADPILTQSVSKQLASCCERSSVLHPFGPDGVVVYALQELGGGMAAAAAGAGGDAVPASGIVGADHNGNCQSVWVRVQWAGSCPGF
jgi:hypothetical protein